jgi:hypothetical protein
MSLYRADGLPPIKRMRPPAMIAHFEALNNGPAHVAVLVVTTDFWITSHIAPTQFQGFGAGFEFWRAVF